MDGIPLYPFLVEGGQTAKISSIEDRLYRYPWCVLLQHFEDPQALKTSFQQRILEPVEQKNTLN